jgi:hypothetical protein
MGVKVECSSEDVPSRASIINENAVPAFFLDTSHGSSD